MGLYDCYDHEYESKHEHCPVCKEEQKAHWLNIAERESIEAFIDSILPFVEKTITENEK